MLASFDYVRVLYYELLRTVAFNKELGVLRSPTSDCALTYIVLYLSHPTEDLITI